MEYLMGGNLMDMLEEEDIVLEPIFCLRMCYEISNGIAFIHNFPANKRLVHGDIKPENILLTEDLHCKIADFGGARLSSFTGQTTTTKMLHKSNQYTLFYSSPELLKDPTIKLKPSHDTYSFGVTVYIILVREIPVAPGVQLDLLCKRVTEGNRPSLQSIDDLILTLEQDDRSNDAKVIKFLKQKITKCWNQNPDVRPAMLEMRDNLDELLTQQNSVQIQQHCVEVVHGMKIKKLSRREHHCASLNLFSPPQFHHPEGSSSHKIKSMGENFSSLTNTVLSSATVTNKTIGASTSKDVRQSTTVSSNSDISAEVSQSHDNELLVMSASTSGNKAFSTVPSTPIQRMVCATPHYDVQQHVLEKTRTIQQLLNINNLRDAASQSKELSSIPVESISNHSDTIVEEVINIVSCSQTNTDFTASKVSLIRWVIKLCSNIDNSEVKLKKLDKCGWAVTKLAETLDKVGKKNEIKESSLSLLHEIHHKVKVIKNGGIELRARIEAWSMCRIGYCYNITGEYKQAVELSNEARLLLFTAYGRHAVKCGVLAICYSISARANDLLENYSMALEQYKLSIEKYKSANDLNVEFRNQEIKKVVEYLNNTRAKFNQVKHV